MFQGTPDLGDAEVVQVGVLHAHFGAQDGHVIAPVLVDVALNAEHAAKRRVAQVLLAVAALHVAAPDPEGIPDVIRGQAGGAADRLELLIGHQRIAATERIGHEEGAGRGDLRNSTVVHEHQLRVDLGPVRDVVMGKGAHGVAFVGALEVVQRTVVEGLPLAGDKLMTLDNVVFQRRAARGKVGKAALRNGP